MPEDAKSVATPELRQLRELAAYQGVYPTDEDLVAVQQALALILPGLAKVELRLPADEAP